MPACLLNQAYFTRKSWKAKKNKVFFLLPFGVLSGKWRSAGNYLNFWREKAGRNYSVFVSEEKSVHGKKTFKGEEKSKSNNNLNNTRIKNILLCSTLGRKMYLTHETQNSNRNELLFREKTALHIWGTIRNVILQKV